uniref:beta-N-acetylhexosaminidase n=1 Tax=Cuerna arida TaxID=1464854 RepID=A0A1B6ENS6_9HEMI
MLKLRLQKVMLLISFFTVLFVLYQLSFNETTQVNPKELLMKNNIIAMDSDYGRKSPYEMSGELRKTSINNFPLLGQSVTTRSLPPLFTGHKIVHLDLKGAPAKVSYYKDFFPLIRSLGATGLLVEYEDMFPYSNGDIPAANMYSRTDIKSILKTAEENNLEVIPLVQTFGHLEFVLKLKEFENLREVPNYPQVICPSRNGTMPLLRGMIDDIVTMHPASRYIHIGCDEVYNLGECNQCLDKMLKENWTKKQLFFNHIVTVASYIKEKYPNVKPLMWDDEFRKMTLQELIDSNIGSLIEPVVWKYTPTVDVYLPAEIWVKYSSVFGSVWIASAFKGATGPDKFVTDISYHMENHRAWMKLVSTYADRLVFKGIMITGWQRYDHFAVLCELLPVGLPSLAVNLAFMLQHDVESQRVPKLATDMLKCGHGLMHPKMGAHCNFPGSAVYEKANQLASLLDQISEMMDLSEVKGWLNEYNIQTGFSSPAHVEGATSELDRFKMELVYLEQDMRAAMAEMFGPDTIQEWVYTYITPANKRLQALWDAKEQLLAHRNWPRRPLIGEL